jgi:two-component system nitrogen regulation response regulator GlnG
MSTGSEVTLEDIPEELLGELDNAVKDKNWEDILELWVLKNYDHKSQNISKDIDTTYEKILIKASLKLSNGNKTEAAKILGWGRNTIANKIKILNIK